MRILNILTTYNEIKFMPYKKRWCELNGLELYVIDNCSKDGTWEWLQKNKIPSHRINTGGAFDLKKLQREMTNTIHRLRPGWIIYNGADTFPIMDDTLSSKILEVDRGGFNLISLLWINICNTGEVFDGDYFNTYFYFQKIRYTNMIAKYHPSLHLDADNIVIKRGKLKQVDGLNINYGNCKPAKERNETYQRRKLAWQRGLHKTWGTHYKIGCRMGWIWKKENLADIRKTEYYKYVQKLQSLKHDKNISGGSAQSDGMRILSTVDVAQHLSKEQRRF